MNWDNIQGNWKELKDALLGRLHLHLGFAQDEAELELDASHGFRSARSFINDVPSHPKRH